MKHFHLIGGHGFLMVWRWVELSEVEEKDGDPDSFMDAGYVASKGETLLEKRNLTPLNVSLLEDGQICGQGIRDSIHEALDSDCVISTKFAHKIVIKTGLRYYAGVS